MFLGADRGFIVPGNEGPGVGLSGLMLGLVVVGVGSGVSNRPWGHK